MQQKPIDGQAPLRSLPKTHSISVWVKGGRYDGGRGHQQREGRQRHDLPAAELR